MTSDSSRRRRGPFCATLCLRRNVASSSTRCSIPRRSRWRQWWGSFSFWERSSLWYLEFSLVCLFVGDCVWRWFSFDPKSYGCHCKYTSTYFYQPKGDEASFSFTTCFECPFYSLYTKIQSTYPLHENPRSVWIRIRSSSFPPPSNHGNDGRICCRGNTISSTIICIIFLSVGV